MFFPKDAFGLCFLLFLVLDFLLILLQLLLGLDNTLVGGIEIFLGVDLLAEQFQSLLHFVVPFKPFPVVEELLLLLFCGFLVCFRCLQLFLQYFKVVPPGNPGNHRANTPLQMFLLLEKLFFLGFEFRQVYIAQHNSSLPADGVINRLLFLVRIIVSLCNDIGNPAIDGSSGDLLQNVGLFEVVGFEEVGKGVLGQDAGLAELVVAEPDQFHDHFGDRLVLGEAIGVELVDQISRHQHLRFLHAGFILEPV